MVTRSHHLTTDCAEINVILMDLFEGISVHYPTEFVPDYFWVE